MLGVGNHLSKGVEGLKALTENTVVTTHLSDLLTPHCMRLEKW